MFTVKLKHEICLTGDQILLYYGFSHRSVKWWKRVFFHLLDVALVNSHILYKAATQSRMTQLDFRLSVAKTLTEGLERPRHRHHSPAPQLPVRLTETAFPEPIPNGKRADCKVCSIRGAGQCHQMGYSCVTHPCAYTPVLSGTTPSKITSSNTSVPSPPLTRSHPHHNHNISLSYLCTGTATLPQSTAAKLQVVSHENN